MTVEELLEWEVPAPFVEGQKLKLRDCSTRDLDNAARVLQVTGGKEEDVKFLQRLSGLVRHIGSSQTIVKARYDQLELMAKERTKSPKKKGSSKK